MNPEYRRLPERTGDDEELLFRARVQLSRDFLRGFVTGSIPAREFEPLWPYVETIVRLPDALARDDFSGLYLAREYWDPPLAGDPDGDSREADARLLEVAQYVLQALDRWAAEHDRHWFGAYQQGASETAPASPPPHGRPARESPPLDAGKTTLSGSGIQTSLMESEPEDFWFRARVQMWRQFLLGYTNQSTPALEFTILCPHVEDVVKSLSRVWDRDLPDLTMPDDLSHEAVSSRPIKVPSDSRLREVVERLLDGLDAWICEHDRRWFSQYGCKFVEWLRPEDDIWW